MLKEHATIFRRLMIIFDMFLAGAAFYVGYYLRDRLDGLYSLSSYFWILPLFIVSWMVSLYLFGMYNSFRLKPRREVIIIIIKSAIVSFLIFTAVNYTFQLSYISRLFIAFIFAVATIAFTVEKLLLLGYFHHLRKRGFNFRNVVIVGTGRRAQSMIRKIEVHRELGLKILGLVDDEDKLIGKEIAGHRVIGKLEDIPQILKNSVVDQIIFVVPNSWLPRLHKTILHCEEVGVRVSLTVDYFELRISKPVQSTLYGFPLITFETTPTQIFDLMVKRLIDIALAFVAIVGLSPLLIVVSVFIKISSPGPVFFRQKRKGLNGRVFTLYKFRTMIQDAEDKLDGLKHHNEMSGPAFKMANDPRVTGLGRFLRKLSIDELPQLFNVLQGDMSLVGPRPPIVEEVHEYDPWHRRRLSMRPGITCLWQIRGRNKITSFDDWTKMDLEYIDNWSLWLDLKILLKTIPVVIFGVGAK